MMDGGRFLEIAHEIPGRIRLRWHGEEPPPEDLLSRLRSAPDMQAVEFRPASRSLVLQHTNGFNVERLRALSEESGVEVRVPPPPPSLAESLAQRARAQSAPRESEPGERWQLLVADAEAVLLVGLMANWIRDLVTSRTVRPGTVILLILTLLNLYQYWVRRWSGQAEPEPAEAELELLGV